MTSVREGVSWPLPRWPLPAFAGRISDALHNGRSSLGWTQSQLAAELGTGRSVIQAWESSSVPDEVAVASVYRVLAGSLSAQYASAGREHRRRANLLAWAVMFRDATLFTKHEWLELFSAAPRLLADVPPRLTRAHRNYLAGEDVAIALEAAVRGMSYRALSRQKPRSDLERVTHQVDATIRLDFELARVRTTMRREA